MASSLTFQDPVCGMELDSSKAEHCFNYSGDMYYFCSAHCYLHFTENPNKYIAEPEEELE